MWKDELRKEVWDKLNVELDQQPEKELCGYCNKPIKGVHDRHSTKFKDVKNPICSHCNYTIEIPRRMKATQGDKR